MGNGPGAKKQSEFDRKDKFEDKGLRCVIGESRALDVRGQRASRLCQLPRPKANSPHPRFRFMAESDVNIQGDALESFKLVLGKSVPSVSEFLFVEILIVLCLFSPNAE
jgi:hypothetical protein